MMGQRSLTRTHTQFPMHKYTLFVLFRYPVTQRVDKLERGKEQIRDCEM